MNRIICAVVVALSLLAARRPHEDVVGPTLAVTPDPATLPGSYHVAGAGFEPGARLVIILDRFCDEDGVQYVYAIAVPTPDDSGSFAFDRDTEFCTGVYTVEAHPSVNGVPDSILATATFLVDPA